MLFKNNTQKMSQIKYLVVIMILSLLPCTMKCSRYDFLLLENFEMTKKIFIKEQEIVKKLQINRQNLIRSIDVLDSRKGSKLRVENYKDMYLNNIQKIDNLLEFKLNIVTDSHYSSKLNSLDIFSRHYHNFKSAYNFVWNYGFGIHVPVETIIDSAMKGLIMLQDTYEQDIKQFSKGHLSLKSGMDLNDRQIDSLQVDDLASMSTIAFNYYKWYDTSLKYLKAAIDIFMSLSSKERKKLQGNLGESLLKMKKEYPLYHNGLFKKKKSFIGADWKLFPSLVDTGE